MKKIAILAGGDSGEYEISIKTAANIYEMLDKELFTPYLIIIKGKEWIFTDEMQLEYAVDKNDFTLTISGEKIVFDAVFIAIHGTPGENGKMQAYFDMIQIPYTGCDMFCSALTFNKYFCNIAVHHFGIPIAPSLHYYKGEEMDMKKIEAVCGFPCFVKPCNSGSSVGVSKVHAANELQTAVMEAFRYDDQLMIEKEIQGREVTCGVAVLNGHPKALAVTEILSKKEYYDYEAKYTPGFLELVTPADITKELEEKIMTFSEMIFRKLNCKGVVRIDYIVTQDNTPYFLEINTIPGQTAMSIIPRQVKYKGINIVDFYTQLLMESIF
jgi:D-alanine-D-alanine ligase